ncbi:hypothetical protein BCR36DRAFT_142246 [Piromyces finnis]|uniref:Uncharacterized protein n=1 Tax=Piromyces finnis TaxID=1754191 RepID=A0A1Y1UYN9_9FUNG|nr:hypothetical protein BCR36DRAFT_142246 [Piromyces finnis]|eukprot:ORX43636.1 hypothetical protein BCR36DRAFT_142246 [Piromyces finnis]
MESLIIKNSISKDLLKKSCSISIINNLNKCTYRQYTMQNNIKLITSNRISLLNKTNSSVPSITLNNSLISFFNNSSLQNSYKYYSTESNKPTDENDKKETEEKDKEIVEEEEEEEEEEDDEIKNITDMKIKISDSAVEVSLIIFSFNNII